MLDLPASDTRVFLFHGADAVTDPGGAMDKVNAWMGKDRTGTQYPNLRMRQRKARQEDFASNRAGE